MRLRGFIFGDRPPPLSRGYVPLGDLTVLLGPNDAGKSRTLAALFEVLDYGDGTAPEEFSYLWTAAILAEATPVERALLLAYAIWTDVSGPHAPELPDEAHFLRTAELTAQLGPFSGTGEDLAPLLVAEPADDERAVWQLRAVSPDVYTVADVEDAGIEERDRWAQIGAPMPNGDVSPYQTDLPLLPRPVSLPMSLESIRARLEDVIASIVVELTDWRDDGSDDGLAVEHTDGWLWTFEGGQAARLHPLTAAIAKRVGRDVTDALPDFISEQYEFVYTVLPLADWPTEGRSALTLRPTTGSGAFPAADIAAGYELWVQLALCETLRRLEEQRAVIHFITAPHDDGQFPSAEAELAFRWVVDQPDEVSWDPQALDRLTGWLAANPGQYQMHELKDILAVLRPWVYLIDEPERHLHPALSRRAARWLADRMREPGAQAVVVTHSADFLAENTGTALVYVDRGARETLYRPLTASAVRATDRVAAEMGFDRGELLTRVRVVLYVEGPMDRIVLQELFGPDLARKGIAVSAFGGIGNVEEILEQPLVAYTTARIAALVDAVPLDEARQIRDDPAHRAALLADGRGERRALARLVEAARTRGLHVEPFGLKARDIFMLLHDEPLRELSPAWPGQRAAEQAWLDHRAAGGREGFKTYYQRRFGVIVNPTTCRQVASRMAQSGRRPAELTNLVDELERLGLT